VLAGVSDAEIADLFDWLAAGGDLTPRPASPTGESEWTLRAAGSRRGYRSRGRLS